MPISCNPMVITGRQARLLKNKNAGVILIFE